jgi:hypothetical protein
LEEQEKQHLEDLELLEENAKHSSYRELPRTEEPKRLMNDTKPKKLRIKKMDMDDEDLEKAKALKELLFSGGGHGDQEDEIGFK